LVIVSSVVFLLSMLAFSVVRSSLDYAHATKAIAAKNSATFSREKGVSPHRLRRSATTKTRGSVRDLLAIDGCGIGTALIDRTGIARRSNDPAVATASASRQLLSPFIGRVTLLLSKAS
jgi:hypothetical protein